MKLTLEEVELEANLFKQVNKWGGEILRLSTTFRGIRDFIVMLPFGFCALVATSHKKGGNSSIMKEFREERVKKLNQRYYFISCEKDIKAIITDWLNNGRKK